MKRILLKIYYIVLNIRNVIIANYNQVIAVVVKPPIIHTTDQTIETIINEKISVSRYGDGELALMMGKDLLFQPYSKELSNRLREIIVSNQEKHIVCIPFPILNTEFYNDKAKKHWDQYFKQYRNRIYKMINMNKEYFDTQVTRLYIDYKDKSKAELQFKQMKEVWNDREVIIIEGTKSRLGLGNDLFNNVRSLNRIICSSTNAFAKYNLILDTAKKQNKDKLFLLALGPTATILAYDLSKLGYQAIDIGHIDIEYEWFLSNATEKIPVKLKYVGEVDGGTNVQEIKDIQYENEIISKID